MEEQKKKGSAPIERRPLNLDMGVKMLVGFGGEEKDYKAFFMGLEVGEFVVVRFSFTLGLYDHLYEGNPIVFRYMAEGTVFGFRSRIIGYFVREKIILAVVTYPEVVETYNLRKETRIECYLPAALEVGDQKIDGVILDISRSGVQYALDRALNDPPVSFQQGQELSLMFSILGSEGLQVFKCDIKSVAEEEEIIRLGLRFSEQGETVSEDIETYIEQMAKFLGGRNP